MSAEREQMKVIELGDRLVGTGSAVFPFSADDPWTVPTDKVEHPVLFFWDLDTAPAPEDAKKIVRPDSNQVHTVIVVKNMEAAGALQKHINNIIKLLEEEV